MAITTTTSADAVGTAVEFERRDSADGLGLQCTKHVEEVVCCTAMTWECQTCLNPKLDDCCKEDTYMDDENCPGIGSPTSSMAITTTASEAAVEFERWDSADGPQCTKHVEEVVCCTAMTWKCQICLNPQLDDCCKEETYMDDDKCPGVRYQTSSMAITTTTSADAVGTAVEFERWESADVLQCTKHVEEVVCCMTMTWECQVCQNPQLDDCCTDETYMDRENCQGVTYPSSSMATTNIASEAAVEFERLDGMQCAKHEVVFVPTYVKQDDVGRCRNPDRIPGQLSKDECSIKSYEEQETHFDWYQNKCRLCQGDSTRPGTREVFQLSVAR